MMSLSLRMCQYKIVVFACGAIVFGLAASANADPKPLSKDEQAKVDKAIEKGVAYLKRKQTKQGDWPRRWPKKHLVGQCALPAYALLEAGVPSDDPVIQKAAAFLRPKFLKDNWTYDISLAILFFDRLGDPKDKKLIQSLALRLIASQHRDGGWSYRCLTVSASREAVFLKALRDLSEQTMAKGQSDKELIQPLEIPRTLKPLTVFQKPEKLWIVKDSGTQPVTSISLLDSTDNSNTQFAMLALWVAQRYDIPMERTFRILVKRFEMTESADGWWAYAGQNVQRGGKYSCRSMICVGLLGLAIGGGLKLQSSSSVLNDRKHASILLGLASLYREIGVPIDQTNHWTDLHGLYFLWSVERVGMLYDLPTVGDKEWYRWGAEILVTSQNHSGGWPGIPVNKDRPNYYGAYLNTAFALLFLKHSHPMKELTPKLSYRGRKLNKGLMGLLAGDSPLKQSTVEPSSHAKPKR